MQADFIINYFTEQKIESVIMMSIGLLLIAFALFFLFIIKYAFFKGIAYSFLIAGILQIYNGFEKLNKAYAEYNGSIYLIKHSKNFTYQIVIPNLENSLRNHTIHIYIEFVFIIIGCVIFFSLKKTTYVFWKGLFLGLIISSFLFLSLDFVSKNQIKNYKENLKKCN